MIKPVRLQISRAKGFNLQAASLAANGVRAVNVARPGRFGNPLTLQNAIEIGYLRRTTSPIEQYSFVRDCFKEWLLEHPGRLWWQGAESDDRRKRIRDGLPLLRGKNLACWCALKLPCHADVLLELANA